MMELTITQECRLREQKSTRNAEYFYHLILEMEYVMGLDNV